MPRTASSNGGGFRSLIVAPWPSIWSLGDGALAVEPSAPEHWAIPELPISAVDRTIDAFSAVTSIDNHIVVDLDGELDLDALATAWAALGRRYPIMRARAELDGPQTHWTVDADLPDIVVASEAEDLAALTPFPGPAERRAVTEHSATAAGGLNRLTVIRRRTGHRLVWSGCHSQFDGWSARTVVIGLADRYNRVVAGIGHEADDEPDPRPRRLEDVLAARPLGPVNRALVEARFLRRWLAAEPSTHPRPSSVSASAGYAGADVTDGLVALAPLRRRHGWRTTAVLIGLLARAWDRVFDDGRTIDEVSGWQVAADLRSTLDVEAGLGNLSATEPLTLRRVGRGTLAEAVAAADRQLAALESGWAGLGAASAALRLAELGPAATARSVDDALHRVADLGYGRSLSNLGRWDRAAESWGPVEMTASWILPASTDPRWITVMAYGQRGRTWISVRTHERGIAEADVMALGRYMVSDALVSARSVS